MNEKWYEKFGYHSEEEARLACSKYGSQLAYYNRVRYRLLKYISKQNLSTKEEVEALVIPFEELFPQHFNYKGDEVGYPKRKLAVRIEEKVKKEYIKKHLGEDKDKNEGRISEDENFIRWVVKDCKLNLKNARLIRKWKKRGDGGLTPEEGEAVLNILYEWNLGQLDTRITRAIEAADNKQDNYPTEVELIKNEPEKPPKDLLPSGDSGTSGMIAKEEIDGKSGAGDSGTSGMIAKIKEGIDGLKNVDKDKLPNEEKKQVKEKLEDIQKELDSLIPSLSLEDIEKFQPSEYLIEQILPFRRLIILGGREGSGKSIMAFQLMKALLQEDDASLFGKYRVLKGGRVLLIDQENPGDLHKERISQMWKKYAEVKGLKDWNGKNSYVGQKYDFRMIHFQGIKVDNANSFDKLKKFVEDFKPTVLVIDSLNKIHRQSEASQKGMSLVMERLRELVNLGNRWGGMSVVVIHHHNKRGGLRGSTTIAADIDIELRLEELKDSKGHGTGIRILESGKTRERALQPITLTLSTEKNELLGFEYKEEATGEDLENLEAAKKIDDDKFLLGVMAEILDDTFGGLAVQYKFQEACKTAEIGGKKFKRLAEKGAEKQLWTITGPANRLVYELKSDWKQRIAELDESSLPDAGAGDEPSPDTDTIAEA